MKKWYMVLFSVCLLVLAACSGDDETSGEKSSSKKELIVAADQDPVGLDPHITPAASSVRIYSLIYERLINMDSEMQLVPGLAEKWEVSEDGKTITFTLRKDVKFHNGRELTSEDVKYSFERILNPDTGSTVASYFASVNAIETPDENTVVFKLNTPDAAFLTNTTASSASIVPKEVEDLVTEAVGTGPFIMDEM